MKIQKNNTGVLITHTAKQPSAKIEFSLDELDALSEFCERLQDEKDIREYLNTAVTIPDSAEVSAPIAAKYLRDAALFEQLVDETRRNQEENQSDFLTAVSEAVASIEKSRDVKEWHGLTKETAERFAREFMAERNPGRWSGFGEVPESVSLDPLNFPINDIYPKGNKPALRMQLISVTYVSRIISRPEWREQACFRDFKSSTDVLRLAAAMSDQDVSLSKAPKFRNFKRGERRQLLELLEHTDKNEGFALHPEEFKRLGERLHPGDYSYIFKEDYEIFTKIRNGVKIETYNSKLQELMKKPVNAELLSAHLMMRPGMFARNLDFALRNCSNEQQMENVLFRFISVCKSIEPRVLVQLINHFRNRNNPVHLATGKANGAASKALERDIEPLSEDICKRVARDIFNQLWQVLRAEDTEPKSVYIDPDCHCNKLIFPDNPRQVTSAVRAAACGSRTNLPDGNVLRAFLYWKGNDGPDLWNGIDLDLSVVFYGEEKAKFVYYANPKDETLGAIHSGDRRCSGKNGAVEYVDFDIKKCFQNGFRYAALTVKSYSGEKFSEMENAFCGVMVRDGKTGEQFEPATVKDRFALTTDSDQLVMVVIDLMTREVITVDKSVAQFRLACRNVVTDYAPTVAACTYAMQLKSLSIKEMLGMRYAQFLKSDDWKHASVIVSDEPEKFKVTDKDTPAPRIVSPYDIPGIYDLIFGKENQ